MSVQFPAGPLAGTSGAPLDPKLGPLFYTGGFTATHSPRTSSPAINAAGSSPVSTDQRGFPRGVGGSSDLGAVERGPVLTVGIAEDSGPGSLRTVLASATSPDTTIVFGSSLDSLLVNMDVSGGELVIAAGRSVQFDASALPNGIRLFAMGRNRILRVEENAVLTLHRVSVNGGNGGNSDAGGGILSAGTVSLYQSDISNSAATVGGALYATAGRVELIGCRLAFNNLSNPNATVLDRSGPEVPVTVTDCWFGNSNPPPSGFASPGIVFAPYIVLGLSISPSTIQVRGSSTLTANVNFNSGGERVAPDRLFTLIGRQMGFFAPSGLLTSSQNTFQADGTATATITATEAGPITITAGSDGAQVSAVLSVNASGTPTPTPTPGPSPTPGATPTPTPTPTPPPVGTPTPRVTNTPFPTATPAPTPTPNPAASRLINVSTRLSTGAGDNVLIAGVAIRGGSKKVIVRALGPSLEAAGVPSTLADPQLSLIDSATGATVASNDNWQSDSSQAAQLIGAGRAPTVPAESALVATLAAGNYTAIVRGLNQGTGNCLVEVYDAEPGVGGNLINLSTRGPVGTGDNVMIAGFVVAGETPKRILVLAKGPSLAAVGVPNTLADPELVLNGASGLISFNANWQDSQAATLQATGLAPTDPREAAIVITLPPGGYTAIVRGANGSRGNAIVEVFELP